MLEAIAQEEEEEKDKPTHDVPDSSPSAQPPQPPTTENMWVGEEEDDRTLPVLVPSNGNGNTTNAAGFSQSHDANGATTPESEEMDLEGMLIGFDNDRRHRYSQGEEEEEKYRDDDVDL